jgi:alkaline phosphatase
VIDTLPFTALSRTYAADSITPDSAPTATALCSGYNTNNSVIGLDDTTEPRDFNGDGDGARLVTMFELAKQKGKAIGFVTTARITHATPAAGYAHVNNRDLENDIALQALPGDALYNVLLGTGIDVLAGGGRRQFVPNTIVDEEGSKGSRSDGRDLRAEYQGQGYTYVWNTAGWNALPPNPGKVLALFESSHMEYDHDRPLDVGGEPSLAEMTGRTIDLLRQDPDGFVLQVEGGRIDHAHHEGNAFRALSDVVAFDDAIAVALSKVDLNETILVVTADHSHVFNIAGYPLRPHSELPYPVTSWPIEFADPPHHGILDVVFHLDETTGAVDFAGDRDGVPYTVLVYGNGPGFRGLSTRNDPYTDPFLGRDGQPTSGPNDPDYYQESAVPMSSETHAGEEVAIYAIGGGSKRFRGTVKNTEVFWRIADVMGL